MYIYVHVHVHVITHVNVQYTVPIKTTTNTCTEEHVVMGDTKKYMYQYNRYFYGINY